MLVRRSYLLCQPTVEHVNDTPQHERNAGSGRFSANAQNQWPNPMGPDHAGDETNAAQSNKSKQNVLHSELADPVADGGRLPNTGEVNAGCKKNAEHWAEHPEHKTALWKHLPRRCLLIHDVTPNHERSRARTRAIETARAASRRRLPRLVKRGAAHVKLVRGPGPGEKRVPAQIPINSS